MRTPEEHADRASGPGPALRSCPWPRSSDTWPRTKALYCHPVDVGERPSPAEAEIVERVGPRSCARRGAAIDVVVDRNRENRSQIVFTRGRGREMVFWQSSRTRCRERPSWSRTAGHVRPSVLIDALAELQVRSPSVPLVYCETRPLAEE